MHDDGRSRPRGGLCAARRGRATPALAFFAFAAALMGLPFLQAPASMRWIDWGADPDGWTALDPRRNPELDIPQAVDAIRFDREFLEGSDRSLARLIDEAVEEHYGAGTPRLRQLGLLETSRIASGRQQYLASCAGCHGHDGDGAGPAARFLDPRPRNFQRGMFKFTTTGSGQRPTRADIFDTIRRGLSGSSMPAFPLLSDERRWDLVEYVRFLALRGEFRKLLLDHAWEEEELPAPEDVADFVEIVDGRWMPSKLVQQFPGAPEPPSDAASVAAGAELYKDTARANCLTCHGPGGKGDGPTASDYLDGWGYPIRPRDLTTGVFRAGTRSQDLYLSIATGINGTPMPAFEGVLSPDEIWSLVHFVRSLAAPKGSN